LRLSDIPDMRPGWPNRTEKEVLDDRFPGGPA
jgi:hypothetical protein